MTGTPLTIASTATRGWFSHQSDGKRPTRVTPQNRASPLDDEERDIGPLAAQHIGDASEREDAFLR
jgi:hypothetical protein